MRATKKSWYFKKVFNVDRSEKFWKRFYQREAKTYDAERFSSVGGRLFEDLENHFIADMMAPVKGQSVLDVATGTGRIAVHLAKQGAHVTALDLTPEMMHEAKQKARAARVKVRFVEGNALRLPFKDESFDAVVSIRFLHLLSRKDEQAVLREMARVLKPGGVLVTEFNNLLYGGVLTPFIELYRTLVLRRNPERFLSSIQVSSRVKGLDVEEIVGIGFPFLGRVARADAKKGWHLGKKLGRHPLKHFSSHLVVKCRKPVR